MKRNIENQDAKLPANWAELLLELSRLISIKLRGGAGISEVAQQLQFSEENCRVAVAFRQSTSVVKLRALVEDWPRDRIVTELGDACGAELLKSKAAGK